MAEPTPQPKSSKPVLPIVIIIVVFGAAFLIFRGFLGRNFAERQAEQTFEQQTGGKADININGESRFEFETEEGKVVIDQQGGLPDDFPDDIQIYDGGEVIAYVSMDSEDLKGFNTTIETSDSQDNVYNFYLTSLADDEWTITSQLTNASFNSISAEKDTRTMVVTVTSDENETLVVLTVKTE